MMLLNLTIGRALASVATGLLFAGSLIAQPTIAAASADVAGRSQKASSGPGSELSIYLMTMGQGDLVWEKFGHNA
ncbi:MAG: hypothetical protein ABI877_21075, partial [Gemmatimonadaceae bacterium]